MFCFLLNLVYLAKNRFEDVFFFPVIMEVAVEFIGIYSLIKG